MGYWRIERPRGTAVIALLSLPNLKDYDFSSFRCLWTGGAPISTELQKQLYALMPNAIIGEGYGLSETMSSSGACTPLYRHKAGFVGIPQSNVDLKIVDRETGEELEANREGESVLKCDTQMLGYWNKPEETRAVLRDGWLRTGDLGLMDEEGYVKFPGRSRELIKCSGYSVFPVEVENLLYQHPAVKEVAVTGVDGPVPGPDPRSLHRIAGRV
jgi:long-chain acyl-CoA synthetase